MSSAREEYATSQNSSSDRYQRDIRYVFKLNSWILGWIGIWPLAIRNFGQHVSNIIIAFHNFMLSFAAIPCILHIVYDQKDIINRLKLCSFLAFSFTAIIKYFILVMRRPKLQHCIEYVKDDWWQVTFGSDREMMLKYAVTGRNLTIIGASFMYVSGIIYHGISFISKTNNINNQTVRPLIYPIYSEFRQAQISPIYEIVYFMHYVCGCIVYSVTIGTYGLAALFATHACGQIQMIMMRLQNLLDGKRFGRAQNIHQRIAAIVKRHVRVVRFAAVVEEILQEVCLVEFTSSVCIICLVEYFCIIDWQEDDRVGVATYSLLFVSFCFNIYILCYIGEILMKKSSQIGSICCSINWYQLPPKSARNLVLIIAISNHPIKLRAGRMVDLSFLTFGSVLKTSVAYLSFLRTLVM